MFCSHIDKKSTKSEGRGESSALVVSEGPELNHEVLPHVPRTKLLAMSELQEAEVSCSYIGHVMWYRLPEPQPPSYLTKSVYQRSGDHYSLGLPGPGSRDRPGLPELTLVPPDPLGVDVTDLSELNFQRLSSLRPERSMQLLPRP